MWYALPGSKPEYNYSYGYQNWYESAKFETMNTRKNVGLFDLTTFAKFELEGSETYNSLQYLCSNNIKNIEGATTYTQMLNSKGGIEADLTVTCIEKDKYRIVTGSGVREHDKKHILKHLKNSVIFKDITDEYACLGIFGPKSRDMLNNIVAGEFDKNKFKFGTGKYLKIDDILIWFQRLSYVGELGWEIFIPIKKANKIYQIINDIGNEYNLFHAGAHAMDIMRMEKGYLHWGHDISPAENPYEASLGFAVKLDKKTNFIGKNYLIKNAQSRKKQFVMMTLKNSEPGKPLLIHDEPIYYLGSIVGETTSGNYSFNYNKNLAFGYIKSAIDIRSSNLDSFEIEIAKIKYKADILFEPLHDPKNNLQKC